MIARAGRRTPGFSLLCADKYKQLRGLALSAWSVGLDILGIEVVQGLVSRRS
jgi:hypothetical protein